ncbi:diguanylate cyclase [Clostridium sp. MCC353]|nr:diguanylate cyclase [Clostridium sp. MCC353]
MVSFYPEHGRDFTTLFSKADTAMYHAKENGKGRYCIYQEGSPLSLHPLNKKQ